MKNISSFHYAWMLRTGVCIMLLLTSLTPSSLVYAESFSTYPRTVRASHRSVSCGLDEEDNTIQRSRHSLIYQTDVETFNESAHTTEDDSPNLKSLLQQVDVPYLVAKLQLLIIGTLLLTLGTFFIPRLLPRTSFQGTAKVFDRLPQAETTSAAHQRKPFFRYQAAPLAASSSAIQLVTEFFTQAGCTVSDFSAGELRLHGFHYQHRNYENIPILLAPEIQAEALEGLLQHVSETSDQQVDGKCFAFLITSEPLHANMHQQLYTGALTYQLALIPLEMSLLRKAVSHSRCAQVLQKRTCQGTGHVNLYELNTPVADPAQFFGRQTLLKEIVDAIQCSHHIGVFGLRKIGKTSLSWQLKEELSHYIVCYVDLQHIPGGCAYLYSTIMQECANDVALKYPELTAIRSRYPCSRYQEQPHQRFRADLVCLWNQVQAVRNDIKIVILLDEAESLLPLESGVGEDVQNIREFLGNLRDMAHQYGFLVSVMISANPDIVRVDTWNTHNNPGFQYYKEVFLSPLNENECNRMICYLGAQMGIAYTEESLSRIYYETGGHPYVTRQLCSMLVRTLQASEGQHETRDDMIAEQTVQVQDVENAVIEYLEYKSDYLESVWQRMTPCEQAFLRKIAAHDSCTRDALISEDWEYQQKREGRKAISALVENRIIEKCEHKYSLTMGLFERLILISN